MREAEANRIGHQLVSEFIIGQKPPFWPAPPRTQMHLVDRHWRAARVLTGAMVHPVFIAPKEMAGIGDDRGGGGAQLRAKTKRIGLQRQQLAILRDDLVFVDRPFPGTGRKNFPDAGIDALAHLVAAAIPLVEITHHRHPQRVGCP